MFGLTGTKSARDLRLLSWIGHENTIEVLAQALLMIVVLASIHMCRHVRCTAVQ